MSAISNYELPRRDFGNDVPLEIDLSPGIALAESRDSEEDSLQGSQPHQIHSFIEYPHEPEASSDDRCTTPVKFTHTDADILATSVPEATPAKVTTDTADPVTPTANLNLLLDVLSPELRQRDMLKEKTRALERLDSVNDRAELIPKMQSLDDDDPRITPGGRKEKSLGLLCQRFLSLYAEYPTSSDNCEISLDVISKELGVERRRIYDIINVFESLHIVSRVAKNCYTWHGKTELRNTLAKLKKLGEEQGLREAVKNTLNHDQREGAMTAGSFQQLNASVNEAMKKDKSLGIMSQRFIMLFLVSKEQSFHLEFAAKILLGDPTLEATDFSKVKTKVRRLYDIANILTSLKLIEKVTVNDMIGRKPSFIYIGPNVDTLVESEPSINVQPSSKHSMLEHLGKGSSLKRAQSFNLPGKSTLGTSFVRHSSLDQICTIASQERERLYYESPATVCKGSTDSELKSFVPAYCPVISKHSSRSVNSSPLTCTSNGVSTNELKQSHLQELLDTYKPTQSVTISPVEHLINRNKRLTPNAMVPPAKKLCTIKRFSVSSPSSPVLYNSGLQHTIIPTITQHSVSKVPYVNKIIPTSSFHVGMKDSPNAMQLTPKNLQDVNGNVLKTGEDLEYTAPKIITPINYTSVQNLASLNSSNNNNNNMKVTPITHMSNKLGATYPFKPSPLSVANRADLSIKNIPMSSSKAIINLGPQLMNPDQSQLTQQFNPAKLGGFGVKLVKSLPASSTMNTVKVLKADDLKLTPQNQILQSDHLLKSSITPGSFFRSTPSSRDLDFDDLPQQTMSGSMNGSSTTARKLTLSGTGK